MFDVSFTKSLRTLLNMTKQSFALAGSFQRGYWTNIENGKAPFRGSILRRIARSLGISENMYLFCHLETPKEFNLSEAYLFEQLRSIARMKSLDIAGGKKLPKNGPKRLEQFYTNETEELGKWKDF